MIEYTDSDQHSHWLDDGIEEFEGNKYWTLLSNRVQVSAGSGGWGRGRLG